MLAVAGANCACNQQTDSQACLSQNSNAVTTTYCVWDYTTTTCSDDACVQYSTNATRCKLAKSCVLQPMSRSTGTAPITQYICYNAQISCSILTSGQCSSVTLCQTVGQSCSLPRSFNGSDIKIEQQCASFPMWSIALLVVWLVIMVIIGLIVMLIRKQKREDAIQVQEDGEVRIDSVQIKDNFRPKGELDRPLL